MSKAMKYIVHSKSEQGFWNTKLGWVHSAAEATKFPVYMNTKMILPVSRGNDSELYVYEYDDTKGDGITIEME
jgi:hypothetical protein